QPTRSMRPRQMWLSSCAAKVESMCHWSCPPRRQLMTQLFPASGPPVLCSPWPCPLKTSVSRRFSWQHEKSGSMHQRLVLGKKCGKYSPWLPLGRYCHVVKRPLAEANEALDLLRKGEVSGRIVLTP